jgi:purine-nucleoside phosphorylase
MCGRICRLMVVAMPMRCRWIDNTIVENAKDVSQPDN